MKPSYSPVVYNTFPESSPVISFDIVMETLGFGLYQLRIYIIIGLMALSEGAHIMAFTLMMPLLKHQWQVSDLVNGLQASLVFFAFLLGSMISGQISDRVGRSLPSFYSIVFIAFFTMASAWSTNIEVLIVIRVFAALAVGFFGPMAGTILTEITPKHLRGRYMTTITFCLVLGELYSAFVGYFLLESLHLGNWRVLLIYCSIPSVFAALMAYMYLDESARYLMFKKKYDEAFDICEKISRENETVALSEPFLSKETKEKVVSWAANLEEEDAANLSLLFKGQKKRITLLLWACWFANSFIYYGVIIYTPLILQKIEANHVTGGEEGDNSILLIFTSNFMELISVLGAASMIENKYFGRKNSMIIFFSATSIISLLMFATKEHLFMIFVTFERIFISLTFIFCFQYTSEVYDTNIRTTGLGMANGIGRIGGVIMPWICSEIMEINIYGPFIVFFIMAAGSACFAWYLPFDTREKDLDG